MNVEDLLKGFGRIHGALNRMKKAPHGTLGFSITYIEYELDALREKVEDAFHEKNDEIDCLREEIMTLTCKEAN